MIDYSRIPEHCRDGMKRWIEHGVYPGDFLTAVLENNLVEAFGRADDTNQAAMFDYAIFLYNEAPRGAWGSKKNMKNWNATKGLIGMTEAKNSTDGVTKRD